MSDKFDVSSSSRSTYRSDTEEHIFSSKALAISSPWGIPFNSKALNSKLKSSFNKNWISASTGFSLNKIPPERFTYFLPSSAVKLFQLGSSIKLSAIFPTVVFGHECRVPVLTVSALGSKQPVNDNTINNKGDM